ncbi:MAG: SdpI family protein [Lachnospiraceae bacterium]|nr:SdpI family protein [Lachnospiraceae bacterium]
MWFWWFMFVCDLMIPILMIGLGRMMWKHAPKNINGIIGYRTTLSMKNPDTWKFAHDYCGRLWWKIGWIMLILSAIVHFPFYNGSENEIGILSGILITIQCVILIGSVFPTERALKRNFTDDGIPR